MEHQGKPERCGQRPPTLEVGVPESWPPPQLRGVAAGVPEKLRILSTRADSWVAAGAISWGGSGGQTVDDQADKPILADTVGHLSEGIPADCHRASRACDPRDHLYVLSGGKCPSGNHGVRGAQRNTLGKMAFQPLDCQGWPALGRVAHEDEQRGCACRRHQGWSE